MTEGLSCKANISEVGKDDMYNPWYNILAKEGRGTLFYNGSWNLFDQIVMTPNMLCPKGSKDYATLKFFQNQIHIRHTFCNRKANTRAHLSVQQQAAFGLMAIQTTCL